ncbi:zinc finger protein 37-like [Biomphalaria glabrata]|uniref:Zinc finger protein 37-like n=1 Tax=Biomphalaria glabrata TaxID=6526 RepID=A0A9W3AWZ4_BIOGL|nr:zinc finger protein 37-like [Biomphalaria glabrata]
MLTLANVLPGCRVHPGSSSGLQDSHANIDFQAMGSRVSLTGQCPLEYFGHAFSSYGHGNPLPATPFSDNIRLTPSCCNPVVTQRPVIQIYPTFVNVTNVQGEPRRTQPTTHQGKPRSLFSLESGAARQGRLPPISMFSSLAHRPLAHNAPVSKICGDASGSSETGFELNTVNEPSYLNQFQYSVQIVQTKDTNQVLKSTRVVKSKSSIRKRVTSSVSYCKKLKGMVSADLTHSIASILKTTKQITDADPSAERTPRAPLGDDVIRNRELKYSNSDGHLVSSDASLEETDDDIDVTSCSGDELDHDDEVSVVASPSQNEADFLRQHDEKKMDGYRCDIEANHKGDKSKQSHEDDMTNSKEDLSALDTHILQYTKNAKTEDLNMMNHSHCAEDSRSSPPIRLKSNLPTKTLPPIESLCQPSVRNNQDGRSAFKPIAKNCQGTENQWTASEEDHSPNQEMLHFLTTDAVREKCSLNNWEAEIDINLKYKENDKQQQQKPKGDISTTDALDMLRRQSLMYQNQGFPDHYRTNGNLPNTPLAWFQWLRHRDTHHGRHLGPHHAEPPHVARCPPPRYFCEACNKTYSTFGGLSKHRQFHCVEHIRKEFACNVCSKSYSSLGALKMHIRTHTLPCKCHVCGKAFSRPWLLQGHVRTHTGEKPFRCSHCGRAFADRSNLRAHLQTHAEIKKYACRKCGKTFSRMSLLTKHSEGSCPGNSKTLT